MTAIEGNNKPYKIGGSMAVAIDLRGKVDKALDLLATLRIESGPESRVAFDLQDRIKEIEEVLNG